MGSGRGSEEIYQLIEEFDNGDYGLRHVLSELIKFLPADTLVDFAADFRRHWLISEEDDYDVCIRCEDTYDINEAHMCDDSETQPPIGTSRYFSSLIPEC